MRWTTPDFEEINLAGEVTAYANTDEQVRAAEARVAAAVRNEASVADAACVGVERAS